MPFTGSYGPTAAAAGEGVGHGAFLPPLFSLGLFGLPLALDLRNVLLIPARFY